MVDVAVRQTLARSAMYHACKERGLTGWALSRRAGLSPLLVIGISLCPLHAHCWAQLGPHFLGDSPEALSAVPTSANLRVIIETSEPIAKYSMRRGGS